MDTNYKDYTARHAINQPAKNSYGEYYSAEGRTIGITRVNNIDKWRKKYDDAILLRDVEFTTCQL